ncbi:MAG: hypothetical protein RQ899_14700 [Pseudomonadales bacterium]|nr:hypothetical protein [Pseudomonadales bacterium]
MYTVAATGEYPVRDQLLVSAALYWGFTATELSLLEIAHVMSVEGQWREQFLLPAAFAFNGLARSAWILDARFRGYLESWLAERETRHWGLSGVARYRGFGGRSPLLLNNQGKPFAMTPRSPGSEDLLPSGMHRQLRDLLDRAGLEHYSPQIFRDTYIVRLWLKGLTRQQIAQLTGIRKAETITRKIRHLLPEPRTVFADFLPASR